MGMDLQIFAKFNLLEIEKMLFKKITDLKTIWIQKFITISQFHTNLPK